MSNYKYDYLIVGAGLAGSTLAYLLNQADFKVKVIDKRNVVAGNCYTEEKDGIDIHVYGPHIFHTSNEEVWEFVNHFTRFNNFINTPMAIAPDGNIYNMPFNMNTFSKIWSDVTTPNEAMIKIQEEINKAGINYISNLEEYAINTVGTTIYNLLVKGYTEKQWGKPCIMLSPDIIKRLPLRFTYNNNYFNDKYQGIPKYGYTNMIQNMLKGIEVELGVDYIENREVLEQEARYIIYTGRIDEYYNYEFGKLEYRSLRFVTMKHEISNYQGNAVINYTGNDPKYTRIIEHKHFNPDKISNCTYITYEFPSKTGDPFYPLSDKDNIELYQKYKNKSDEDDKVIFAGRLGKYKYFDMDDVIEDCLKLANDIIYKRMEEDYSERIK